MLNMFLEKSTKSSTKVLPLFFFALGIHFFCLGESTNQATNLAQIIEQGSNKIKKVNSSRLIYSNDLAFVKDSNIPFSGIAFTEGENWRAEVSYKEGILDGEVVVVANKKLLSRFRYDKGKKILD